MPKKSTTSKRANTFKRSNKRPQWQLPLLAVLVAAAVGFGIFVVFFSKAGTAVGPHMYMAASNNTTDATFTQFDFGIFGDRYVAGDWDANKSDTLGVYRPSTAFFYLTNSNSSAGVPGFQFGNSGDIPIAGDWNGDGTTTVGVYRPTTGKFYLRNSNSTDQAGVKADVETLMLGNLSSTTPDKVPIACDWNGDGITDLGLFRTSTAEWETFASYGQQAGAPWVGYVATFVYGNPGDKPVCGDWNSDKTATPGVYRDSNSTFYLKNTNDGAAGWPQRFGQVGFLPLVGRWTGTAQTLIGAYSLGTDATTTTPTTPTTAPGGGTVPNATGACVGDLSRDIKQLQRCINSKGGNLTVDGIIGPLTRDACKAKLGAYCPTNVAGWSAGGATSGSNSGAAGPTGPNSPNGSLVTAEKCNTDRKAWAKVIKAFNELNKTGLALLDTRLNYRPSSLTAPQRIDIGEAINDTKRAIGNATDEYDKLNTRDCTNYLYKYVNNSLWTYIATRADEKTDIQTAYNDLSLIYKEGLRFLSNGNGFITRGNK